MNKTLDEKILKASFKDCLINDRKKFFQSKCIIPISVGQPIHEGKKFLAAMKLINASFKSFTLLIDDSVQRHTMGIESNYPDDYLYKLALQEGDEWLKRNQFVLNQLTIPYNIMRWDDWLISDKYQESYLKVKKIYLENEIYRNAIHANIDSFLTRYLARISVTSKVDQKRAFGLCLDYLLEECAVMCLWVNSKYEFEIYPSGRNEAMTATYEYLIKPYFPNLLKPVALRFKKYPQPQNQKNGIDKIINKLTNIQQIDETIEDSKIEIEIY